MPIIENLRYCKYLLQPGIEKLKIGRFLKPQKVGW
jgi:hypothetical protein